MSLSIKVSKLFETKDVENIKLARNIIIAQVKQENVVALICALKKSKQFDICEERQIIDAINEVLSTKVLATELSNESINYTMPILLRWALQQFKSVENIDYAHHVYLIHIQTLIDKAHEEIKINKVVNTVLTEDSGIGDDDELPF